MKLIVTRHPALVDFLIEVGLADKSDEVITHATVDQVKGKDVIGVLPLSLAVHANSITEIPLSLTPEMRGKELDLPTIRAIANPPQTYKVLSQASRFLFS